MRRAAAMMNSMAAMPASLSFGPGRGISDSFQNCYREKGSRRASRH
jgi:hypothetical protein